MITFRTFLLEKEFAEKGHHEVLKTSVQEATEFAKKVLSDFNDIQDFKEHYELAIKKAKMGKTLRKDMPRIRSKDIDEFKKRLSNGSIDITEPYAEYTTVNNLFPVKLSGKFAKNWLSAGKPENDGSEKDDIIKLSMKQIPVKNLVPIQKQMYLSESLNIIENYGVKEVTKFLKSRILICSSDMRIIDGHHRFLAALLVNPEMELKCLMIDLDIQELLPLSLAYGDAIGNKRNR